MTKVPASEETNVVQLKQDTEQHSEATVITLTDKDGKLSVKTENAISADHVLFLLATAIQTIVTSTPESDETKEEE